MDHIDRYLERHVSHRSSALFVNKSYFPLYSWYMWSSPSYVYAYIELSCAFGKHWSWVTSNWNDLVASLVDFCTDLVKTAFYIIRKKFSMGGAAQTQWSQCSQQEIHSLPAEHIGACSLLPLKWFRHGYLARLLEQHPSIPYGQFSLSTKLHLGRKY